MKHIIVVMLLVCLVFAACKKSFLNMVPQSQVSEDVFYKNTADISNAVTGAYMPLQNLYFGISPNLVPYFPTMMEARADNIEDLNPGANAGTEFNIDRFLAKADNVDVTNAWAAVYNGISRCNQTLQHLEVVINPALRSQFEGELKFLRALHYFNLVRLWGAVPLVLRPVSATEAKAFKRNSPSEIYSAIEADLIAAAALLPVSYTSAADLGRATQGAAKGLLAKVYLTQGKYLQTQSMLKDMVIAGNSYGYSLQPNIADVFSVTNKMNTEIVFAVRYNKTIVNQGHGLPVYFNQPGLDPKLLASYEISDARKELLNTITLDANNKPVKKYQDVFDINNKSLGNDFIILRYADLLLMYAEAENELAYSEDAFLSLNAVRARAGASLYSKSSLPDQATFRKAVLAERRLELPLELHRWFDLLRTNTAVEALQNSGLTPITITTNQYLYPIPQSELDLSTNKSGFTQNPGY